jgi:hypothetical protein
MSALSIAHEVLNGDLNNTIRHSACYGFLYLCDSGFYFTLNKTSASNLTYISTVEEFNNFKGDNVTDNIYTKEMADNDVLPSVGELVQMRRDYGDDYEFYNGRLVHVKAGVIWFDDDRYGGNLHSQNEVTFKPLTPPVKLDDGKAYQFDYINKPCDGTYHGLFNAKLNRFIIKDGFVAADYTLNIQPLTVEAKS